MWEAYYLHCAYLATQCAESVSHFTTQGCGLHRPRVKKKLNKKIKNSVPKTKY